MLETPHVIVAAAIAVKSGNPWLAIPLSLVSHFVLDEVPHWNPHLTNTKGDIKKIDPTSLKFIFFDSTLALVSGTAIALTQLPDIGKFVLVIACSFIAVFPDVIEAPYIFLGYKRQWLQNWLKFQKRHQFNTNIVWGLTTQVLTVAACLWWIAQK